MYVKYIGICRNYQATVEFMKNTYEYHHMGIPTKEKRDGEGFRVAMIEEGGAPIEFIQTQLSDEELDVLGKQSKRNPLP